MVAVSVVLMCLYGQADLYIFTIANLVVLFKCPALHVQVLTLCMHPKHMSKLLLWSYMRSLGSKAKMPGLTFGQAGVSPPSCTAGMIF